NLKVNGQLIGTSKRILKVSALVFLSSVPIPLYQPPSPSYIYAPAQPTLVVPRTGGGAKPLGVYPAATNQTGSPPPMPVLSESELKQIEEMFPNIEKEVIKTVFEANRGNKESTINSLLQMAE
ncbi:unnamed protein product, partial [Callosobruchus maculatus]